MAASSTPVLHHDMLVAITELCDYSDLQNLRLACKPLLGAVQSAKVTEIRLSGTIKPEQMPMLVELFPRATSLDAGSYRKSPGAGYAPDSAWMQAFLRLCSALSQRLSRLDVGGCRWTSDNFVYFLLKVLRPSQLKILILQDSGLLSPEPLKVRDKYLDVLSCSCVVDVTYILNLFFVGNL